MGGGISTPQIGIGAFSLNNSAPDVQITMGFNSSKQKVATVVRNESKKSAGDKRAWGLYEDLPKTRVAVMERKGFVVDFKTKSTRTYSPKVIPKCDNVRMILAQAVSKNILFASYSKDVQNVIIDAFDAVQVKADEYVIRQGENGDVFYIVESGTLEIYVKTPQEERKVGSYTTPGSAFGELALMYNVPRAASIKAATDCVLWSIHRKVYREAIINFEYQRNKTYVEFLRNVEVLGKKLGRCLTVDELEKLAISMDKVVFNSNDVIVRQGDEGDNFYMIVEGEVDVYKSISELIQSDSVNILLDGSKYQYDQSNSKIGTLHPGQYFGERALITNERRQATTVARTTVTCLALGRENFILMLGQLEDIVKSSSDAAIVPNKSVSECSQNISTHVTDLTVCHETTSSLYSLDKLTIGRTLGKGTFGQVMYCVHKTSGEKFAIKCQSKKAIVENGTETYALNELEIMQKITHPYIAKLYAAMQDEHSLYFLMELLPGGELFTYLQDFDKFAEVDARFYAAAVVSAFKLLHAPDMRIAYRDLKPENIVLARNGLPKLVDFGLAKLIIAGKTYTMCGSPDYLAPEVILNLGHNHAVDYWALGIFISELVAGQTPFTARSTMAVYDKILYGSPRLPSTLSRLVMDLIFKLIIPQQGKRLGNTKDGINAIISHKWFSSFDWKKLENCKLTAPFTPKLKKKDEVFFPDFDESECYSPSPCSWVVPLELK